MSMQEQTPKPEAAEQILLGLLSRKRQAINALRSFHQFAWTMEPGPLRRQLSDELRTVIEGDELSVFNGNLCEFSDTFWNEKHSLYSNPEQTRDSLRGFQFLIEADGLSFECIFLDAGGSRKYFEQLSVQEQRKYVEDFAKKRQQRKGIGAYKARKIQGFTAFVDEEQGSFKVIHISRSGIK